MMHEGRAEQALTGKDYPLPDRQSDQPIVPLKEGNASGGKGLTTEPVVTGKHRPRSEGDQTVETKLGRLTEIARGNPKIQLTSLAYYLDKEFLRDCYEELKVKTSAGVDQVTVEEYGKDLESNLSRLVERMKAKRYRPQPVRRATIPKSDGSPRMRGVPAVEDRVVQRGIAKILSAIYEGLFLECSFGFRPNRSAHQALDRVDKAIMTKPIRCVVDYDIEKFFDNVDHRWMMECLKQRIKDPSLLRLIVRFLKAGVMDQGNYLGTDLGTPQGGNLSPILSNVILHYVLDLWFEQKIKPGLKGYAQLTRFCDDFLVVFERRDEAEDFGRQLRERLAKFGLKIKEAKSRIVGFGQEPWRESRNGGDKIGTFDFLGFTHFCEATRKGNFKVGRKTSAKKLREKMKDLNLWMKSVRNAASLKEWWPVLRSKLLGHYRYYGVSGNIRELKAYYTKSVCLAYKWVNRRSQKRSYNWPSYHRFLKWNALPQPRIYHDFYAFA